MTLLRLFSPSSSPGPSRQTSRARQGTRDRDGRLPIRLTHHVPSFGGVYLSPPPIPLDPLEPRKDVELNGQLEIQLPDGCGGRRCKSIKVGLRTVCTLDIEPGRTGEEDVIFERKVEIRGGNEDGIRLEEGTQMFDWTIILPNTLAPHDWHPSGRIVHHFFAELQGLPEETTSPSWYSRRKMSPPTSRSHSHSRSTSRRPSSSGRAGSGTTTPLPGIGHSISDSLNSITQVADLPKPPGYASSSKDVRHSGDPQSSDQIEWLKGTYEGKRTCMLIYNPNPNNGVSDLDVRVQGSINGLGTYDIRYSSDIWSISALLRTKIALTHLPPRVVIFNAVVSLEQTTHIVSPRDPPDTAPIEETRSFVIWQTGERPSPERRLDVENLEEGGVKAIWRAPVALSPSNVQEAEDLDLQHLSLQSEPESPEWETEGVGRLPDDEFGRPTTCEGVITPIRVSHHLIINIYFAIIGEDERGQPCEPSKTGLRILRLRKSVLVPSCAIIPENVELPVYASIASRVLPERSSIACPSCRRYLDRYMTQSRNYPSTRHNISSGKCYIDYDKANTSASGSNHFDAPGRLSSSGGRQLSVSPQSTFYATDILPQGQCRVCGDAVVLPGSGMWTDCACGLSLEQMQERMKGKGADEDDHNKPQRQDSSGKIEDEDRRERGRQMGGR